MEGNCANSRFMPLLDVISRLDDKDRQIVIGFLDDEACDAITECIHNGLHNHTIGREHRKNIKNSLKKDQETYRCILKEKCLKKRRDKLVQVGGGGLGVILPAVLANLRQNIQDESL